MAKAEMSMIEAVRRAQAKLGKGAKPLAIQEFVKSNFKINISTNMISSYKTYLKKKKGKPGRKPKSTGKVGRPATSSSGSVSLEDIRAVKELADRIGANRIKEIADVLAN